MHPNSDSEPENGAATELSRREELLAVATKLFAARGYHGTRINDVADVVGLNKATVYHYYASKSLILFDIYREAADRTVAAVHDEPSWSAREAIFHFTRRLLENIANNIDGAAVYFQESPYITEWFTEEQVAYIRAAEFIALGAAGVQGCEKPRFGFDEPLEPVAVGNSETGSGLLFNK